MLIALIDDGILAEECSGIRLEYDLVVGEDGIVHPRFRDERILTNHGTTCAQIIHKYAPSAEFCSLSIFQDPNLKTSITKLLAALQWCRRHGVPIIHMSVGTTRLCDHRPAQKLIFDMLRQGQLIIAAHSNRQERYTMPACYTGVLGVATAPELQGPDFCVMDGAGLWGVQILASSRHDLSEYPNGCKETVVSNSYAAPTITAKVHEIVSLSNGCRLSPLAVYRELAHRPISIERMYPDFLTEAIVFDAAHCLREMDCIAFTVLERHSNEADFLKAIKQNRKSPLVFMPSTRITPDFIESVCLCSEEWLGIVYAGAALSSWQENLPCVLWDENVCRSFFQKRKLTDVNPEIAMIRVEPQGEGALYLLSRMKTYLMENGYGCIAISDFPGAYLYGLDYLPGNCGLISVLSSLCYAQHPDIVLCSTQDNTRLPHENMLVRLNGNNVIYSENTVVLPSAPTEEDIQKLLSVLEA